VEYQRYGEGFVKRESADEEWVECSRDDVPNEVVDELDRIDRRHQGERDESDTIPFVQVRRVSEGEQPFEE
jgi:hypothetical protein